VPDTSPCIVSEAEALKIGGDLGFRILEACAAAHVAHNTTPATAMLYALVAPDARGIPSVLRVGALPATGEAAITDAGAAAPVLRAAGVTDRAPTNGENIELPRTSVAGVLVALRAAAPDSPALRSMPSAQEVLGSHFAALLSAAETAVLALSDGAARTQLQHALQPFTAPSQAP